MVATIMTDLERLQKKLIDSQKKVIISLKNEIKLHKELSDILKQCLKDEGYDI